MSALILELIDKQDTFEIVRDQIAAILTVEIANQVALATAQGAPTDPTLWNLKIYTERSDAWEEYRKESPDPTPIVNVWYESSTFDPSASDVVKQQKADGIFNIDIYGYGVASDDGATGHNPGDREAAYNMQRALRLVRNILMSAQYVYLALQGTVWKRWPQSVTVFQPEIDKAPLPNVVAARFAFAVDFSEFSPQNTPETLEVVSVDVKRTEDGEIVLEADYDYTAP